MRKRWYIFGAVACAVVMLGCSFKKYRKLDIEAIQAAETERHTRDMEFRRRLIDYVRDGGEYSCELQRRSPDHVSIYCSGATWTCIFHLDLSNFTFQYTPCSKDDLDISPHFFEEKEPWDP
jgi:hypothetical protein